MGLVSQIKAGGDLTGSRRKTAKSFVPPEITKQRKGAPHQFVLDAMEPLAPRTRRMFGCLAIYVQEKIVLILRDRGKPPEDDGVWLATTEEHHESLRREFPSMRSIQLFGKEVTHWQVIPADAHDFEEAALRACELIAARDNRIGKVPKGRKRAAKKRSGTARRPRVGA